MNPETQAPPAQDGENTYGAKASHQRRWFIAFAVGLAIVLVCTAISRAGGKMSPATTCQEKLHQLDEAATQWGANQQWNKRATAADMQPYFRGGKLPVCESGGTYTFGSLLLASRCSVHGHDQMEPQNQRPPSGFTRVFRQLFGPRITTSKNACIANLKQIDGAIQQWALENHKRPEDSITNPQNVADYLKGGAFPTCPQGGKYDVSTVGANPTCTIRGHEL